MHDVSKHEKLYRELKKELILLEPGDKIPSMREIMQGYSVSQATVTKSITRLKNENLIEKSLGLGTFVTNEVLKYKSDAKPIILVSMPRWVSALGVQIEQCFESAQEKFDFSVEFNHFEWPEGVPRTLPDRKIDGLVVIPSMNLNIEQTGFLRKFDLPFVIFDRSVEDESIFSVCADNRFSGALAADYLVKLGHKKLALVISEPKVSTVTDRISGFVQYCELQGAKVEIIDCGIKCGDRAIERVYLSMKQRLNREEFDISGIFVTSEASVLGVYKALYEKGFAIPGDISVIAIDDQADSEFYYPALTTISSNIKEQVNTVCQMLISKIKGKSFDGPPQQKLKSRIIERESTRKL